MKSYRLKPHLCEDLGFRAGFRETLRFRDSEEAVSGLYAVLADYASPASAPPRRGAPTHTTCNLNPASQVTFSKSNVAPRVLPRFGCHASFPNNALMTVILHAAKEQAAQLLLPDRLPELCILAEAWDAKVLNPKPSVRNANIFDGLKSQGVQAFRQARLLESISCWDNFKLVGYEDANIPWTGPIGRSLGTLRAETIATTLPRTF